MARAQWSAFVDQVHKLVGGSPARGPSDGELLESFVAGADEAAFAGLVRRHGGLVLHVCRRVLGDAHAAEDAFQATFLVLARKATSIRRHESVASWLYGVASRVAHKARAVRVRRQAHEHVLANQPEETAPSVPDADLHAVVHDELVRLAERHRAPLVLCYLEGKTYGQAARELGWPEGSMSRRLAQAREVLRQRLLRRGVGLASGPLVGLLQPETLLAAPDILVTQTVGAAIGPLSSAGAAGAAAGLAEGVLQDMFTSRFRLAASVLLTVGVAGLVLATRSETSPVTETQQVAHVASARTIDDPEPMNDEAMTEMANIEEDEEAAEEPEPTSKLGPDLEELLKLPAPATIVSKRRDLLSEEELRRRLQTVPELTMDPDLKRAPADFVRHTKLIAHSSQGKHPLMPLLTRRADLAGLPLLKGDACELDEARAGAIQRYGRELRSFMADASDGRPDKAVVAGALRLNWRTPNFKDDFARPEAVPTMVQMLMAEPMPVRRVLAEQLGKIRHPSTSVALARLSIYDLAPEVRADALAALVDRPADEYRAVLLSGFGYPWAPVADHAAEAVVALKDRAVVPALQRLLEHSDATSEADKATVPELVRINHFRNCMLCHAVAPINRDSKGRISLGEARLVAPTMTPGQAIPTGVAYYLPDGELDRILLVRADITYLRQDFSALQPVADAAPWPSEQRFDYLVRRRPATVEEDSTRLLIARLQREAILWAIKELGVTR